MIAQDGAQVMLGVKQKKKQRERTREQPTGREKIRAPKVARWWCQAPLRRPTRHLALFRTLVPLQTFKQISILYYKCMFDKFSQLDQRECSKLEATAGKLHGNPSWLDTTNRHLRQLGMVVLGNPKSQPWNLAIIWCLYKRALVYTRMHMFVQNPSK